MKYTLWIGNQQTAPMDLVQVAQLYQLEIIGADTQAKGEGDDGEWGPITEMIPQLHSVLTNTAMVQKVVENIPKPQSPGSSVQSVNVNNVEMGFGSMVGFMVKWVFASIPAAIIVALICFGAAVIIGGISAALFHH